jgi:energy-coupling factor transport system permease protein
LNAGASGPLVRVDPRVKLLWLLATLVGGLVFADVPSLAALLLSIVVVAAAGGVLGETARRVQGLVTIIAVVGLIFGITVPGAPLFGVSLFGLFVAISRDGLLLGLVSALRMCIFAAPLVVMVISTTNSDMIQGLMALRLPLDYALMIVLALNLVPLYVAEMERITDAQKARGHALVEQGIVGRLRGLVPIFVPLTLNAVDRADTIGKVLEMRGVSRRQLRPEFEPLGRESWLLLAATVGLFALALAAVVGPRLG